jgi:hypothetical protein
MELVADPSKRISFIYGYSVIVLYFYSRKQIKDIEKIFFTALKPQVDMIFVFRNTRRAVQYIVPPLKIKLETHLAERQNINGSDINALRDVLAALGNRMQLLHSLPPLPTFYQQQGQPNQEQNDQTEDENSIINSLLNKMRATGYESLSPAELDFIKEYKARHRKNDQDVD